MPNETDRPPARPKTSIGHRSNSGSGSRVDPVRRSQTPSFRSSGRPDESKSRAKKRREKSLATLEEDGEEGGAALAEPEPYWVWHPQYQKYYHYNRETNEVVWQPDAQHFG